MKRIPVRIRIVPFLIPTWAAAQVILPNVILIKRGTSITRALIAHELTHVKQWNAYGIMFPLLYMWQLARHGYAGNRFEIEARAAERNSAYLAWADDIIAELR